MTLRLFKYPHRGIVKDDYDFSTIPDKLKNAIPDMVKVIDDSMKNID